MEVNAKDKSRRRILKGLAAGTAVASIPAKSVWANTVTTSIVASGQGSSNLTTQCLAVLSPGYYKNHSGWPSHESFYYIFGGDLIGTADTKTSTSELRSVTLQDVLDAPGGGGTLKVSNNKSKLGGPSNVNYFLVAMYANAYMSGSNDVWFPVADPSSGGAYSTPEAYARDLYSDAKWNTYAVADEMSNFIDDNHVGNVCQ
ncbi:MAG TPA: hypothetical protein DCW74_17145 [Alteromonas australica]|jgi:hypothetical protein|uniref:Uncharacterized protein n=1 Tax=Alteromonas australica TaxID=589873 RepID=A0A358DZH6_9ALTE|nr:hypothetical protein [Alteromonas australica]MAB94061.1 hypothetical protein [Alteromonas sp.]AJP44153.1 hypothetical protein EP12_11230 [Alteromonas australica]MAO30938.1 hypothetical protein [Alteromonas sp.]MBU33466.1 hypothetical protein [Alteromonas sp.]HAI73610.1 hypothetical protein [Alteromonas australica]|tara:strand:+ start:2154 stop:2756 length:603 start_codon:yes stop_codon:yes gene_type:complete